MTTQKVSQSKLLGRPVTLWIKTFIWSTACVFLIAIGYLGSGDCEESPRLPAFLMTSGTLHLAIMLLQLIFLTEVPVNWQELQENEDAEPKAHPMKMVVSLLGTAVLVLNILGTIWTYPKASDYFEDPGATCNPWIFVASFILITLFYIALIVSCAFVCLAPFVMPMIVARRIEQQKGAAPAVADNV